jgi:probable HAF family extracellular repeat protein
MLTKRITLSSLLTMAGLLIASAGPAQATPALPAQRTSIRHYHAVDLGIAGSAAAINDRGQIVGDGAFPSGPMRPFLWDHGRTIDLGLLPGEGYGRATDINNRGQIVGESIFSDDEHETSTSHAFLWQNGRMTDLGTLGGPSSRATAINDRGQIVGYSDTGTGPGTSHGFLWENGRMIDLGMSRALDINNRGQVVGHASFGSGADHACLWQNGVLTNLDTGPEPWQDAVAINDHGWIVGNSFSYGPHAFLWRAGVRIELESLGGAGASVVDVNERGQVLGQSDVSDIGPAHAVIWEHGRLIDLAPYGMPDYAMFYHFNNSAQIVGYTFTDDIQATLWT